MADATATADLKNTRTATQNHTGLLARLGPGLITGAADDDSSGIATYSQVGAQFGYGMLWTMLFTFLLMAAIQEICARLGRITRRGVAANLRENYPRSVLLGLVLLLCSANIFNIGADVSAMGACAQLVLKGRAEVWVLFSDYHEDRTHLGLTKQAPSHRMSSPVHGGVIAKPRLGGLHHRYQRAA